MRLSVRPLVVSDFVRPSTVTFQVRPTGRPLSENVTEYFTSMNNRKFSARWSPAPRAEGLGHPGGTSFPHERQNLYSCFEGVPQ